jgi:hypothetical protein
MPGLFVVKAIEAAPMSSNRVRAYILNALKRQAKRAQIYLAMTTEHWVTPPIFRDEVGYQAGNPFIRAYPSGNVEAVRHWIWVEGGTRVRYATLSPDWESKTQVPGSLGTNVAGKGKVLYISKLHPRPGIIGRNWSALIRRKMQPDFTRKIQEAVEKGLTTK